MKSDAKTELMMVEQLGVLTDTMLDVCLVVVMEKTTDWLLDLALGARKDLEWVKAMAVSLDISWGSD